MAIPEEFEVVIGADGKIRLDFRGMSVESYRRIVEVLQETVGPAEALDIESEEDAPPRVIQSETARDRTRDEEDRIENRQGS